MTFEGRVKGGKARAEALTPERRSEIARNAAQARSTPAAGEIPTVLLRGTLKIGDDFELPCAVLSDGSRVITEQAIAKQLGRGTGGKTRRLAQRVSGERPPLPDYLTASIEEYVPDSLRVALSQPRFYPDRGGMRRAIDATLLPEVAEVWLKARDADVLQQSQTRIADRADLLMRALSRVGIIALVDEATGYQEIRERDELQRILSAYINDELLPWTKRFPDSFYDEMFRLQGWAPKSPTGKKPRLVGKLTRQLVYDKLPPGVVEELSARNPVVKDGRRKNKLFQFLTDDIGNPHLTKQVDTVTTLMRVSTTWNQFKKLFNRNFPPPIVDGAQPRLIPDEVDEDEDD